MAKLKVSILLMILSKVVFAGENITTSVDVEFDSELTNETLSLLLPVTVIVNDNEAVTAWLDLRKNYKFIFEKKTQTTLELAEALKTLSPARSLRFSCATSELELCQKYNQFDFGYDFETGKLTLIYDLKNATISTLESEPAAMLSQNLSYSESNAGLKYRSGQWNGKLISGVTENSVLETSLQYTLDDKAMVIDDFSWKYLLNDRASLITFYREQGSSLLSKFGIRQLKGIAWDYSAQDSDLGTVKISPVVIDANSDGIFNIYDEYGSFVKTTPAMQGINRIELPQTIKGNFVRIDLVVVGERRDSFEFPIIRSGETSNAVRLEAGISEAYNNEHSQQSKKSAPFLQAMASTKNVTAGISAVSETNQFVASTTFRGFNNFQFGAESLFKKDLKQHDLFANFSNSLYEVNYFVNVAKSFSENSKLTLSTGASKSLIGNSRIDLYYNQSSSNYNSFTTNASSKKSHSKKIEYKMLSMKFSSRFQTNYGFFDYNISTSTDLSQEKRLGLSISYRPASRSKYFKPTAGIQFDKNKSLSFISNEMRHSESLRFIPEVRFNNSALTHYGTAISYTNESINADTSFYKTTVGHDFYINSTSNTFISRDGIKNTGNQKNLAYRFTNSYQGEMPQQQVEFNINGYAKKLTDGEIFYDYSGEGKSSQIYSQTPGVSLSDKYNSGVLKPFRLYNVEYTFETNKLIVSGRVFDGLQPLEGVTVLNHAGKTTSDKNGYFSLQVSKMEPVIMLSHQGYQCNISNLNVPDNENEVYLNRIQCAI